MRDKQAFEAYVLEKSKIEKNKIAMRRKAILTAGMSLCVCVIALMVLPGLLEQPPMTDGFNGGAPEALPGEGPSSATPVPTMGSAVGGTEEKEDETTTKPVTTEEKNYGIGDLPPPPGTVPQKALPLDQAFAQGQSDYAIPNKIECLKDGTTYYITETPILCDICDWVLEGTFADAEGIQSEAADWTIIIYYSQDSITCYVTESGLFKMAEGAWLQTDPAYVRALLACFGG